MIEQLQAIQLEAGEIYRTHGLQAIADNPPTPREIFLQSSKDEMLQVAYLDTAIIGFALVLNCGIDCHLEQISILPKYSKCGYGGMLLKHMIKLAEAKKFARITLSTFRNFAWNEHFYRKCGFQEIENEELGARLYQLKQSEEQFGLNMKNRLFMAKRL